MTEELKTRAHFFLAFSLINRKFHGENDWRMNGEVNKAFSPFSILHSPFSILKLIETVATRKMLFNICVL